MTKYQLPSACPGIQSSGDLIDIFVQSQISSPSSEFRVLGLGPGTRNSGFGVWHGEISHLYFCEFQASGVWVSGVQVISTLNLEFQVPGFGTRHLAPGTWGSGFGMVKFHIYIFVSFGLWVFGHPEVR
jgi:hypothetical protein